MTRTTPRTARTPRRSPRWVYGVGDEPDYRFSFANERTFLAWIRTSLAVLAGGVALDTLDLSLPDAVQLWLASLLIALAILIAPYAWWRWARAERAIRLAQPLPASHLGILMAGVLMVAGIVTFVSTL
jgi:inner membrane protein YidH